MFTRDMVLAVKEMLERHWDTAAIAARLRLDYYTVQQIIDFINNVAS